jgi:hypothetical protein
MKRDLSHREIKSKTLGLPTDSGGRTRLIAAGNPDVLREAFDVERPEPRVRSGPAWASGLKAWGGPHHTPGKMDGPDIGREKVITY